MILKSIRLRGFKGFRSGLGVDEVSLDLSVLPHGLVAVCGSNGAGKTTLLDNLHPYRIQPYKIRKAKDWSTGAFSYYDQCYGSDACKELVFEMGDVRYRSLILIDAERRKQEAYLYQMSRPHDNWEPLNDGKVKTYDEAVEKVCGSPSLFFTSVFRCQGAKNLSDYTRGDIMQIISELLNIDHIREQGEKCRAVVSGLNALRDLSRDRMALLSSEADAAEGLQADKQRIVIGLDGDRLGLSDAQRQLLDVQGTVAGFRERQAAAESDAARLGMLRTQLDAEKVRLSDGLTAFTKASGDLARRKSDAEVVRSRTVSTVNDNIARAQRITSGAQAIRDAVVRESEVVPALDNERVRLISVQRTRDDAFQRASSVKSEIATLTNRIAVLKRDADKLAGLDCRGDASGWLNPTCRFISDAVAGRDALPAAEEELAAVLEFDTSAKVLADADLALADCRQRIQQHEAELAELSKFTRLMPELDLAEKSIDGWTSDAIAAEDAYAAIAGTLDGEMSVLSMDWDSVRSRIMSEVSRLQGEVDAFPASQDWASSIREASILEGTALASVSGFESRIRDAELQVAALETKLEAAQGKLVEVATLRRRDVAISTQVAKFSLLMKACSNDGIIALELDDAAPSIAALVNDLLRACYGSRFVIRLDTQAAKVGGDMKETFDIVVFDNDSGDERSITECSGGQVTVLEDAITRGICLYNIHRSDRVYGTLYSDEKDGALDEARKIEFMRVKREALRLGTHSFEFFISQTPDLIDMADARIVLADGKAVIV